MKTYKRGLHVCPRCGSKHINTYESAMWIEDDCAYIEADCEECDKQWDIIFEFKEWEEAP